MKRAHLLQDAREHPHESGVRLGCNDEQDFARSGQGAIESIEPTAASDVERETDRDEKSDSNIEGGVG